jgi:hypothetical protein
MAEKLSEQLYRSLRAAVADGSTVATIANGRPNRVTHVGYEGCWVVTDKSAADGKGPQLVPAWMIQVAWDHLERTGSLTNEFLLASDGLNVKRSSAVCALLARLPEVTVTSTRSPIRLELNR